MYPTESVSGAVPSSSVVSTLFDNLLPIDVECPVNDFVLLRSNVNFGAEPDNVASRRKHQRAVDCHEIS
jgi:hypothetical protein